MNSSQEIENSKTDITFWSSLWVECVVACVVIIAAFSTFSLMRTGAWVSFAVGLMWTAYRIASYRPRFITRQSIKENPLLLFLVATCLISLLVGSHCFLDSYSYRIPQMLFWLQEGHPWSVPNVDIRINQMPHVWSFLSAVFFLPFGERGIAIPNFISFLLLAGILKSYAARASTDNAKHKWLVLIFISAPVFVMGAATNDNVVTCVTFLMLSLFFALQPEVSTRSICYSALAFALCCGIKPQYVTLAPLWALWFFFAKPNPAKRFRWICLVVLIPLAILCSPVPTLGVNYLKHGSITQPCVMGVRTSGQASSIDDQADERPTMTLGKRTLATWQSVCTLINQMTALPVNPLGEKITREIQRAVSKRKFFEFLNWHTMRVLPVVIPEGASYGFFTTLAFCVGLLASSRNKQCGGSLVLGSSIALLAAIFVTTPSTLGRSFIGFFLVMTPYSLHGLAHIRLPYIKAAGVVCSLAGLLILVLNPARPLWPCVTLANHISHQGIRSKILSYAHYSKRQYGAHALMNNIPDDHPGPIGTVMYDGNPMVELWRPFSLKREVRPYPTTVSRATLESDNVDFLVIRHHRLQTNTATLDPAFIAALQPSTIQTNLYTSYMQKGDEPWFLVTLTE